MKHLFTQNTAWAAVLLVVLSRCSHHSTGILAFTTSNTPVYPIRRQSFAAPRKSGWIPVSPVVPDSTQIHPSIILRHIASSTPSEEDDEEDTEGRPQDAAANPRDDATSYPASRTTRDKLKDWLAKETNMVRPIRMEDGTFADVDRPSDRVVASMSNLSDDMPQISDILGGSENDDLSMSNPQEGEKSSTRNVDHSWFDPMAKEIEAKYEEVRREIMQQLEELKRDDPQSVPVNAEQVMESVWRQEMEEEIAAIREKTALDIIAEYEAEERTYADRRDVTGLRDEKVDKLMEQSKKEQERQDAFQAAIDKYADYEEQAFRRAKDLNVDRPGSGDDLDTWALQRLEEMLFTRQDSEANEVLDNLEENVIELQRRIEKEKRREGRIRPETAKEWQMYRSIATRLAQNQLENSDQDVEGLPDIIEDEDAIAIQMQSWKRFQEKEESIRKQSGLARGPRLPFEWQEVDRDAKIEAALSTSDMRENRSRSEIRRDVNQKALEAMEDLIVKTQGTRRGDQLLQNLEALRSGLESDTVEDELEQEDITSLEGPVDVSDVFSSVAAEEPSTTVSVRRVESRSIASVETDRSPETPLPPSTPFFSEMEEVATPSLPAPDTPFFTSDDENIVSEKLDSSKLGTIEEQKLRTMYRKANATTEEEQDRIRRDWEAFQNIEKERRDRSGLSDNENQESLDESELGYDVEEVMTSDGDIDAEMVLSKIGPRPKRGKDKSPSNDNEVIDDMFRAVSAVGGGRTKDDPEAKAQQKSAFESFVRKEEYVREILDEVETGMSNGTLTPIVEPDEDEDGVEYADSVLNSMQPRPTSARKRKRLEDFERAWSDESMSLEDDEDEDVGDELEDDTEADLVPEWLRKEQEPASEQSRASAGRDFLGSDLSSLIDEEEEYQKNMRQLDEYERRKSSTRPRQMGIDISDALGRGYDDYQDYKYDDYRSGALSGREVSTFQARKANLLEYEELNVIELNSLMAHKDSVQTTGVSQYMPRIKQPFKEFGAVFRLEGVLLDITGLHYQAWKDVAEKYSFGPPALEDCRRAAVTQAEIAVRRVFCWTDDFVLAREVARAHNDAFARVFDGWMDDMKLSYAPAIPNDVPETPSATDREITASHEPVGASEASIEAQLDVWTKTAEHFGFKEPTLDQIMFATVISPDDAVSQAFRWTTDADEIATVVRVFHAVSNGRDSDQIDERTPAPLTSMGAATRGGGIGLDERTKVSSRSMTASGAPLLLTENDMLEIQYQAWLSLAAERNFDPPTPDEALGAMVINDPALIIRDGYAWTSDQAIISDLTEEYLKLVEGLVRDKLGEIPEVPRPVPEAYTPSVTPSESPAKAEGPTKRELLEMHGYAWAVAAEEHDLGGVAFDKIHLTVHLLPQEAVTVLYPDLGGGERAKQVTSTFSTELKKIFKQYMEEYGLEEDTDVVEKPAATVKSEDTGPSEAELFQTVLDAWKSIAKKRGFTTPNEEYAQFSMAVGPQDAVEAFGWTNDVAEQKEIIEEYLKEVERSTSTWKSGYRLGSEANRANTGPIDDAPVPVKILPGTSKWLHSLMDVEMQCGVVSHLTRKQIDVLLDYTGLSNFFPVDKRVGGTCGYHRESQQLLGAALRLERRPDQCVVFDTTPQASLAAHDVEMKSVSMIGVYPMYELLSADSTARYCDELTAMNIRRLFGERIYDQPMFESQQEQPGPQTKTRLKTRFWEEGDRDGA